MNKNKHMTLDIRCQIEKGLNNRSSFKTIAAQIGKDSTTVSKEIKNHILFEKKGAPYRPFNDCIHRRHCSHYEDACKKCERKQKKKCSSCGECTAACPDYQKESCPLLLKPPYVCNGCPKKNECTLEKHRYDAAYAQKEYEAVRSESRCGFNLSEEELKQLDSVISPLLKNGQSIHHILLNNQDRIPYCEKTIYRYADSCLFSARNSDMPRKVRFRPRKSKSVPLKVDKSCRTGRTYEDFLAFRNEHPGLPVVELDSVEGKKGGAVLLTIHFVLQKFQLAFRREANDSQSVTAIFEQLYKTLGKELYMKLFPVLLADNGTEFSNPKALEFDTEGNRRSYVFYCHPSSPGQKGSCEVNHEFIRRIIPKGTDITPYSGVQIQRMMNHINSYGRGELGNKSPYEMMEFYFGKNILELLGFETVPANDIILRPALLKND